MWLEQWGFRRADEESFAAFHGTVSVPFRPGKHHRIAVKVIDPRGNFVGELGSSEGEDLLVRDLDLDMVQQMRDDWQFYRDRRPDSYTEIAKP